MKMQRSLSFHVTLWTAAAIAFAMGIYGVYQYVTLPGATLPQLAAHHLWHVAALGVVIYAFCWTAFQWILIKPLNQIYLHLYEIGTGELRPLHLTTRVREIQTVVEGINLMVHRLQTEMDALPVRSCRREIRAVRELTEAVGPVAPREAEEILERLDHLEQIVTTVIRMASAEQPPLREDVMC